MIRVQVVALVRLTRAALPGMTARGRGAIINVSSIAAFTPYPDPSWTVYCATKAFVNTFTRGVQDEVRATGVRLQALCPAFVPTEIFDRGGFDLKKPEWIWMAPEALVDASLVGLRLGEVICFPSLDNPALLTEFEEMRQAICDRGETGMLAERYAR
jgi:short-subunit dehydrogenase